jgi:short-chain fatty acids transporter
VATKGHIFEEQMGVLPVSQTLFSAYNIIAVIICLISIPILMGLMRPKKENAVGFSNEVMEEVEAEMKPATKIRPNSYAERIERMRWINIGIGGMLAVYLGWYYGTKGLALNLNVVNWSFLAMGFLLADSPVHYVRLVSNAGRNVGQIILQYPLYAGLMGLMVKTGLAKILAGAFTAISSKATLAFWAFISGGILNMFIPSGGGQWSVQGAVFIEAAKDLGVPMHAIVNAVAYGDQWTNMVQPFWTIPLLAIAGLKMRDMMGYTFLTLIWTGIVFTGTLLFLVPMFS